MDILNTIHMYMDGNVYDIGVSIHLIAGATLFLSMLLWGSAEVLANILLLTSIIICCCSALAYGVVSPVWSLVFLRNTVIMVIFGYALAYPVRNILGI